MDKLEKATIQQAFVTEESQRRHRASAAPRRRLCTGSYLLSHSCILYSSMRVLRPFGALPGILQAVQVSARQSKEFPTFWWWSALPESEQSR